MLDNFDDIPFAPKEVQDGVRRLLEERLVVLQSSHMDLMASYLAQHPPLTVVLHGSMEVSDDDAFRKFYKYTQDLNYDVDTLPDDRDLPEWQKRRNQSQQAKQKLVDKLKAKRK